MTKRLVYLVPGFFGFDSVGTVNYFEDVVRSLDFALRRRGVDARIVRCVTQPTASIPRRADALRRQVIRSGGLRAGELHFVGHSTGGLDVRMLLTPGVKIARSDSEARIAALTQTAISARAPCCNSRRKGSICSTRRLRTARESTTAASWPACRSRARRSS